MIFNIITIISTIVIVALLFLKKENKKEFVLSNKFEIILAFLLGFVFLFLLFFKLGSVPYGLHVDEAGMAFDAMSLVRYGVDRYLYPNPVYFINFGGGQNALYTYLASFVIQFGGYSITNIRIPAVILSIIAAFCYYFMIRKEKGKIPALISLFLFCVLPFSIMHSRWSLESYLFFPLLVISCYFFKEALSKKKNLYFFLTGVFFGITLYTYAISYLILPFFLGFILLYALINKKIKFSNFLFLGVPLAILAIPLILMLAVNNGLISEIRLSWLSIPKMLFYRGSEFSLSNILENWKMVEAILGHDGFIYNSFKNFGTLYYISIPFLIYGFYKSFKKAYVDFKEQNITLDFLMIVLFFVIFAVLLLLENPNINRANAIFVPLIYFVVMGIYHLISRNPKTIFVIVILYLVQFIPFAYEYFVRYPEEYKNECLFVSQDKLEEALLFAESKTDGDIYIVEQNYIFLSIAKQMSPYEFQKESKSENGNLVSIGRYHFNLGEISKDNVYILIKKPEVEEKLKSLSMNVKAFDDILVYYE